LLELIDVRTLALSTAFMLMLMTVVMVLYQAQRKVYEGFNLWVWSQSMFALGFLIQGTRDFLPGLISIIGGNGMIMAGFIFARRGYRKFFNRHPFNQYDDVIVTALSIILLFVFSYWQDRVNIRSAILAFAVCWMSLRTAWELSIGITKEMRSGAWFGAIFFLIAGLITAYRGFVAITHPEQVDIFVSSWANVSVFLFAVLLVTASSFSILMLTSTRLEMELKSAQEEMELLAHTDHLTGLYNRRYFMEYAQREFIRARRFNQSVSILFADLDYFKEINDKYGHRIGDKVLKRTGEIIQSHVRQVDLSARFGGEEFIILLIQGTAETMPNVAERIWKAIEADILEVDNQQIPYTISIGVASLQAKDKSVQDVIDRADTALYHAKKSGRNQVQMS
jgi:diguanylate cyclase (GGDEF)-like protein